MQNSISYVALEQRNCFVLLLCYAMNIAKHNLHKITNIKTTIYIFCHKLYFSK